MGKKTRIFYWIIRGIAGVIFISAVIGLILNLKNDELMNLYVAYALNAAGLLIFTFVPNYLFKRKIQIPNLISNIYLVMLSAAMLLGEILGFYKLVRGWDSLLHFSTPGLIGLFAYSLINVLNNEKTLNKLTPFFVFVFVFSFTMMTGVIWEIYEFAMDTFLGWNMQRFKDNFTGEPFIGRAALFDTMKDFMLNTLGALIISVIVYIDAKKSKVLAEKITLRRSEVINDKV